MVYLCDQVDRRMQKKIVYKVIVPDTDTLMLNWKLHQIDAMSFFLMKPIQ